MRDIQGGLTNLTMHVSFIDYGRLRNNLLAEQTSFRMLIRSSRTNSSLINAMDRFINTYQQQKNALLLLKNFNGMQFGSLETTVLQYVRQISENNFNSYISSSNRILFEFYISAYVLALQSNDLLRVACNMRSQVVEEENDNCCYAEVEKEELTRLMTASLQRINRQLSNVESLRNYRSLMIQENADDETKFVSVIQTFVEHQSVLSERNSCAGTCRNFGTENVGVPFGRVRCHGTLYACTRSVSLIRTYLTVTH